MAASIKRAVITFLLGIWRGCNSVCNGVAMRSVKRGRTEDVLQHAFSRPIFTNDKPCAEQQCCRANWARPMLQCLPVRVCGLLYVVRVASGRVAECGSANRV